MDNLTIFIRRPVLATMLSLLLVVLGLFSYRTLGVDTMPDIEIPIVTVTTILRGASPEEVESQVTKPLEEAVNTIEGVDELRAVNTEGMSRIVIKFHLERKIAEAAQDVRDKVATVIRRLPADTEAPVITKMDFDAIPILTLAVTGPRAMKEISEIARLQVKEAIENIRGVGAVIPLGNWTRAINIFLDLDRLQSFGIPVAKVKLALAAQNVEIPSGRIDRGDSEQVLRTLARIERVQDFMNIVVANVNGRHITIGDIGRVEDAVEEPRTLARLWKKEAGQATPAVSLVVQKQSGTNTVQVIHAVKKRLKDIAPTLPPGIRVSVIADQSRFIESSIDELRLHLVLGGILTALSVLLFMRSLRSTLIAAVAIPTSLIATFTFMSAMDFTLNNMSLLGLTLAVGIVIDDAIVVLENIFRHMEELGKPPLQAAIDGLQEIGLAVMATTTSLVVIFLPVAFMSGMAGRFFHEFGLTVAFAIFISLIISFTLTPMLSAKFLTGKKAGASSKESRIWRLLQDGYDFTLRWALRNRGLTVLVAAGCVLMVVPLVALLGKDFLPPDDRSEFQASIIVPAGSSLSSADAVFKKIEAEIQQVRGVTTILSQIGSTEVGAEDITQGTLYIGTVDISERDYPQKQIMQDVRAVLSRYPELRSGVYDIEGVVSSSARQNYALSYNLTGPDLGRLMELSDEVALRLRKIPGFVDVDTSLVARKPEVRITLDRPRAADLGVSASDVALALRTMVGGDSVTKFREDVEQYDVWLRLDVRDRCDADIINRLPIGVTAGRMITLNQVADLSEGRSPAEIDRFNRQRQVTIFANLENLDLGKATGILEKIVADMKLPVSYAGLFTGRAKQMGDGMVNMLLAFVLAFVYMYIVLAAQFESFLHPVTILLALPLTLPFAFFSLLLLGDTLNIYSLLGIFMLFGIVKKNGILQIDYTNSLVAAGKPLTEAILEANRTRLRPIMMTTITLIAGMVPIALGTGPGAASRASMAKVIIGGQALSLLITLLIVPVCYSLFEGAKLRLRRTRQPSTQEAWN